MTKSETQNIISYYNHWKLKQKTCRKFGITKAQLDRILKEEGYA
jgi:hypothetical protein